MQVHFGVESLQVEWPEAVVCVGTFDGVHRGHQELIGAAVTQARDHGLPCVVVTFDRHPASVLNPGACPPAIASLAMNVKQIERLGVAATVVLAFTHELSQTSAEDFLNGLLIGKLRASRIVIGHDFAFGHGRRGNAAWLEDHLPTVTVPAVLLDGARISSSAVRDKVLDGKVEEAEKLLGRSFEIEGVVVPANQVGRELGYPTANLARTFDQAVPSDGVYAGIARTPFGDYRAAISIGDRPTFAGSSRTIEAYLLDYPGESLYGRIVALQFRRRLRGQETYANVAELVRQIEIDVAETARLEV